MQKYEIKCYLYVEPDEPLLFDDYEEAVSEKLHLEFLHPENCYRISEV